MMASDLELLQQYARDKSEPSFAALVDRHLGLVYSAALRQVRSPQFAEEVVQSVFTDLARQAHHLAPDTILAAWLYQVARRTAIDLVRREARRRLREQIASEMNAMNATTDDWTRIEPLLDDAMHALDETDRAAVLLRYFENKSLREVGLALGASEDAAQKRVSRAVERLRGFFARRGVALGAGGLAAVVSANAVQAAPAGLAAVVSTAAAAGTTLLATTTTATVAKTIAMTALQKSLIAVTLIAAGTGVYELHQASTFRTQVDHLRQEQAALAGQIRQLQLERDDATRQLAGLRDENERMARNTADLLKLRAEVTRLRNDSQELARLRVLQGEAETNALAAESLVWQAKVNKLKQRLEQSPNLKIPELQLMDDRDWLAFVKGIKLENDADYPEALGRLRQFAKEKKLVPVLSRALRYFARANDNQAPADLSQLQPYLQPPLDPAILARYQILQSGTLAWDQPALGETARVDPNNDSLYQIGAQGDWYQYPALGQGGSSAWGTNEVEPVSPPALPAASTNLAAADATDTIIENSPEARALAPIFDAYKAQHNGDGPGSPTDLVPYLATPADKANFVNLIQKVESVVTDLDPDEKATLEKIRSDLQK
jgi:RNA polymerase sigma factor (sigma-70 family)